MLVVREGILVHALELVHYSQHVFIATTTSYDSATRMWPTSLTGLGEWTPVVQKPYRRPSSDKLSVASEPQNRPFHTSQAATRERERHIDIDREKPEIQTPHSVD